MDRWCKDRDNFAEYKNVGTVFDMPLGLWRSRYQGSKKRPCRQEAWWEGERNRQLERARLRARKRREDRRRPETRRPPAPVMSDITEVTEDE